MSLFVPNDVCYREVPVYWLLDWMTSPLDLHYMYSTRWHLPGFTTGRLPPLEQCILSTVAQKYKDVFLKSGFDDVSFNSTFAKMKFTVLFTVAWCGHRSLVPQYCLVLHFFVCCFIDFHNYAGMKITVSPRPKSARLAAHSTQRLVLLAGQEMWRSNYHRV